MSKSIDDTMIMIRDFLEVIEEKINNALDTNTPLPATVLADEVFEQFGLHSYQAYHLIGVYLLKRPELRAKQGRNGGITYVKKEDNTTIIVK